MTFGNLRTLEIVRTPEAAEVIQLLSATVHVTSLRIRFEAAATARAVLRRMATPIPSKLLEELTELQMYGSAGGGRYIPFGRELANCLELRLQGPWKRLKTLIVPDHMEDPEIFCSLGLLVDTVMYEDMWKFGGALAVNTNVNMERSEGARGE
jgi:hypothetical protein